MGMKRKNDANESDSSNKKSSKKKKCATPKGQKKMTSFFAKQINCPICQAKYVENMQHIFIFKNCKNIVQ